MVCDWLNEYGLNHPREKEIMDELVGIMKNNIKKGGH